MSVHYTNESDYSGIGSNDLVANDESKIQQIGKEFQQEKQQKEKIDTKGEIAKQADFINISGVTKNLEFSNLSDISVKSFYLNIGNSNR